MPRVDASSAAGLPETALVEAARPQVLANRLLWGAGASDRRCGRPDARPPLPEQDQRASLSPACEQRCAYGHTSFTSQLTMLLVRIASARN